MAKQPEMDVRRTVTDALRWDGWFVFYCLQGLGCYPGLSDLIAIKGGRVVFIEVKAAKGAQSSAQRAFETQVRACGGEYRLCRGVEDLKGLLARVVVQQDMRMEQGAF